MKLSLLSGSEVESEPTGVPDGRFSSTDESVREISVGASLSSIVIVPLITVVNVPGKFEFPAKVRPSINAHGLSGLVATNPVVSMVIVAKSPVVSAVELLVVVPN